MMDVYILDKLQKATIAAVAASTTPSLPIAMVNVNFTPPNDQKYLECVFIPNNRDDFWNDERNYSGLFRLILHWPKNNDGAYPPMRALNSVAAYFHKDLWLDGVQITMPPDMRTPIDDKTERLYPCGLRYAMFGQS